MRCLPMSTGRSRKENSGGDRFRGSSHELPLNSQIAEALLQNIAQMVKHNLIPLF